MPEIQNDGIGRIVKDVGDTALQILGGFFNKWVLGIIGVSVTAGIVLLHRYYGDLPKLSSNTGVSKSTSHEGEPALWQVPAELDKDKSTKMRAEFLRTMTLPPLQEAKNAFDKMAQNEKLTKKEQETLYPYLQFCIGYAGLLGYQDNEYWNTSKILGKEAKDHPGRDFFNLVVDHTADIGRQKPHIAPNRTIMDITFTNGSFIADHDVETKLNAFGRLVQRSLDEFYTPPVERTETVDNAPKGFEEVKTMESEPAPPKLTPTDSLAPVIRVERKLGRTEPIFANHAIKTNSPPSSMRQ